MSCNKDGCPTNLRCAGERKRDASKERADEEATEVPLNRNGIILSTVTSVRRIAIACKRLPLGGAGTSVAVRVCPRASRSEAFTKLARQCICRAVSCVLELCARKSGEIPRPDPVLAVREPVTMLAHLPCAHPIPRSGA